MVGTDSNNIKTYYWDFGDNITKTTNTKTATHEYASTGNYILKINITDDDNKKNYKEFQITVGNPKEIIGEILKELENKTQEFNSDLDSYPEFEKNEIKKILNLTNIENKLRDLQREYIQINNSGSEKDYNNIMKELLKIRAPEKLKISRKTQNKLLFFPVKELINLDAIASHAGGDYTSERRQDYIDSIYAWNMEKIKFKGEFKEVSVVYQNQETPLAIFFNIELKSEEQLGNNPKIILRNLKDISFKSQSSWEEKDTSFSHDFSQNQEDISFVTTEKISLKNIPIIISPSLENVNLNQKINIDETEKKFRRGLYLLWIAILFFLGLGTYIFLQEWYKRKYERYLFKNRNNLYNIVSYVQKSKKEKKPEDRIKKELKRSGWSSDQIIYVLRKYSGKRTGMVEIPVNKFIDKIINLFTKKNTKQINKQNKTFPQRFINSRRNIK
jgi:PKD repeat protein